MIKASQEGNGPVELLDGRIKDVLQSHHSEACIAPGAFKVTFDRSRLWRINFLTARLAMNQELLPRAILSSRR